MNQYRNAGGGRRTVRPRPATEAQGAWEQFGLRPLTARSALASVLLGTDPPELPTAALVRLCGRLGITEGSTRVALSRMVAAGEVEPSPGGGGGYRLIGPGLLARREMQEQARRPPSEKWDGTWNMMVVALRPAGKQPGATGGRERGRAARPVAERAEVRRELAAARLAEWREGVWLRPANLPRPVAGILTTPPYQWLEARPAADPAALAAELWPLGAWAERGRELLAIRAAGTAGGAVSTFAAAAALLRHLRADPLLPPELLPAGWPGDDLRQAYAAAVTGVSELLRIS